MSNEQRLEAENQKLRLILQNLVNKLAGREAYISELETDNQIMLNQFQQQAAFQAASQQSAGAPGSPTDEAGETAEGGEEVEEPSNVVPFPGPDIA